MNKHTVFVITTIIVLVIATGCPIIRRPKPVPGPTDISAYFENRTTKIDLQTGTIAFSPQTTNQILKRLRTTEVDGIHVVIKTKQNLTIDQRTGMNKKGLRIIAPLGRATYIAKLSKAFRPDDRFHRKLIVNISQFKPVNKVAPAIWNADNTNKKYMIRPPGMEPYNYVVNDDATLNLTVQFYEGVSEKSIVELLKRRSKKYSKLSDTFWKVITTRTNMNELAKQDIVQHIDAGPIPFLPENDNTRRIINVDTLQNFNTATGIPQGLGGQNVDVGIFDTGIDNLHNDFTTTIVNNTGTGGLGNHPSHGTHVAGIALGNGTMSNQNDSWGNNNNGTAFQWRGMAPQADLIDAPSVDSRVAANYLSYISNNGMDISNHSYSLSFDGDYDAGNRLIDREIQGSATSGGNTIPPRLMVFSAGNHGTGPWNGGEQVGYFAVTKQMKNALVVGNYDATQNRIATGSSLGPAHDGRIKPDVVAPGSNITSCGFCPACPNPATGANQLHRNYYRVTGGTSMAAPATTGTLSLILQQWAATFNVNLDNNPPWPSTLRAIIIHSARDVSSLVWFDNADARVEAFPGPDFVTGWGIIDAEAAVNVVQNRRIIEDDIQNTCDTKQFTFHVSSGNRNPIRATLAWDDLPAAAANPATAPMLINDLDLTLVDPDGTEHYPYLLNQTIVNQWGNPITDQAQTCGTAINVQTHLQPTPNPNFVGAANPANVNDPIQQNDLRPATFGRDHLNTVEVVDAQPTPGTWTAIVSGFDVPQGPQNFSLILPRSDLVLINPIEICELHPALCPLIDLRKLCKKWPILCEPKIVVRGIEGPIIKFRHKLDTQIIQLDKICWYVLNCPGCSQRGYCPGFDISLTNMPDSFAIEVYDSSGKELFRDLSNSRNKSFNLKLDKDKSYFMLVKPGMRTRIGKQYEIPMKINPL